MSKPVLVLDLVGVLAKPRHVDGAIEPGAPITGARAFLQRAMVHFDVRVLAPETINGVDVRAWLIASFGEEVSAALPRTDGTRGAFEYIGRNVTRFDGTFPDPRVLLQSKPWC